MRIHWLASAIVAAAAGTFGGTSYVAAQEAVSAGNSVAPTGLEEIVVSAQRRTENLQTTPIAISAISGALLESRNLDNVTDLGAFVPNAVIQPLGAGWGATMAAFIRGVGLGDNILSFEPGVPIYVDDVYIGRPQGSIFDLLDLERVEVLRGPQGTLFGKNAEAGTIRLISVKPQGNNTGNASFNSLWTQTGLPAITIPSGRGPRGLPLGLQIVGRYREDQRALQVARWCEATLGVNLGLAGD